MQAVPNKIQSLRALRTPLTCLCLLLAPTFEVSAASSRALCAPASSFSDLSAMTFTELVDEYCKIEDQPHCDIHRGTVLHMLDVGHGLAQPICGTPKPIDPVGRITRENCGAWQVHDYWIGMDGTTARAVRPTKRTRSGLTTKAVDGYDGELAFDHHGLRSYRATIRRKTATPALAQDLEHAFTAHFGEPFLTNSAGADGQRPQPNVLLWKSNDCNAIIGLETDQRRNRGVRPKVLFLQRLSTFKRKVRAERPKQPLWSPTK